MSNYKIVLTGGPCGGKTRSIPFLVRNLNEQGYSVSVVEESANSLLKLGYIPNINISEFDFQNLLFNIQFINEYNSEGKNDFLICDRGLIDGKVYIGDDDFRRITELNNLDEQVIKSTYDFALYFKSIAYEYPELFSEKRQYETREIAIHRDRLCMKVWFDKIVECGYSNLDGFDSKQEYIFNTLCRKIELLDSEESSKLSDYYDNDYIDFLMNGVNNILDRNKVSEDVKIKTKGMIR